MPGLKAIIDADARPMQQELNRSSAMATRWSRGVRGAMQAAMQTGAAGGRSTIFNKQDIKSQADEYASYWQKALLERDVNSATRSNRARSILRERKASAIAEAKEVAAAALSADIEAASRSNRARRLWRERAERREAKGSGHGGGSGAMRESLVLLREMSAGNWNKVPGSLSILLGQLGLFGGAATIAVGVLSTLAIVLGGVAVAAAVVWGRITMLTKALSGLQLPDFHPEYIAKHLQKINQALEAQKAINREIKKSVELYNSASQAAARVAEATEAHFDHLLKMNDLQNTHKPQKREAEALELRKQKREAEVQNKLNEKSALEAEGIRKQAEADAIKVNSKEHDDQLIKKTEAEAKAGEEFLSEHKVFGSWKDKARATALGGLWAAQSTFDAMSDADKGKAATASAAIRAHKDAVDRAAENEVTRTRKSELNQTAGDSISKAVVMAQEIADKKRINAQANADDLAETRAKLRSEQKMVHGSLTGNQQIGAYAAAATSTMLDLNRKQLYHLGRIDNALDKIGGGGSDSHRNIGRVQH